MKPLASMYLKPLAMSGALAAGMLLLSACSGGGGNAASPLTPQSQAVSATHPGGAAPLQTEASSRGLEPNVRRACNPSNEPNVWSCMALIRTDVGGLGPDNSPVGYTPGDLQSAYDLPSSTAGAGQTIAVVEAYDDPNAQSDFDFYRKFFKLPKCKKKCFQKVNQNGQKSPLPSACGSCGWDVELSLDMEMVSAICPNCDVIVVEAESATTTDLGTGVDSAIKLGATVVSNSYGGGGTSGASFYDHPGTIITASAGDDGYGVAVPAGFPTVVAVGGTTLHLSDGQRSTETVWGSSSGGEGTGSGCETSLSKPSWQTDTGCKGRTMNDVSADANPNTGVAIYDTYSQHGWLEVGGTSVSSPVVASIYGLAGNASTLTAAQSLYASGASLFDVTSGADGSCSPAYLCTAETGYDGPTGNGAPIGATAF